MENKSIAIVVTIAFSIVGVVGPGLAMAVGSLILLMRFA